jgi:hypothetical protein
VIDLSLNEAEALAAKVARGAGFSWGIAEDIGRAARALACSGAPWAEALAALTDQTAQFERPSLHQMLHRSDDHAAGNPANPLCPIRTALLMLDAGVDLAVGPLQLERVALPIWIDALLLALNPSVAYRVDYRNGGGLSSQCDVTITSAEGQARSDEFRRASITPELLAALQAIAHRTYVPESERSRARGAGGGSVDGE